MEAICSHYAGIINVRESGITKRNRVIKLGAFQDDQCFFCKEPLSYLDPYLLYENDDVAAQAPEAPCLSRYVSGSVGGSGQQNNLVVAHRACSTAHGSRPKGLDEDFRALCVRRGNIEVDEELDQRKLREQMTPETFSKPTPAMVYLCDLSNQVESKAGVHLRRRIVRRLEDHMSLLRRTRGLDEHFRAEVIRCLRADRDARYEVVLDDPYRTVLANVMTAFTRRELRGE